MPDGLHPPLLLRRRVSHHMGMAAPLYYTADEVIAMPDDGNRYEVVHGELLATPAPRLWHELLVARLIEAVGHYLRA